MDSWHKGLHAALTAYTSDSDETMRSLLTWLSEQDRPAPVDAEPAPADRYLDLGALAEGGMGEVRRVLDQRLDRVLVKKILKADRPELATLFWTEACVTARLEHPGVVPIHDFGETPDGRPYFIMKEVRGQTLRAALGGTGWSTRRLVGALVQVCQAVAMAHEQGLLHRDLKTDNIMLGDYGEVLVLDWGLAIVAEAATAGAGIAGTPGYMPPEQARGEAVSAASDVFALGAVLFEILTGAPPYTGESAEAVLETTRSGGPNVAALEDAPEELAELAAWALAERPADRPQDAAVFAARLTSWLDGDRRLSEAEVLVEKAAGMLQRGGGLRAEAEALAARAKATRDLLADHSPVSEKAAAWALEDEGQEAARAAELVDTEALQTLRAALSRAPELAAAHQRIADYYRAEAGRAEARRDRRGVTAAEAWVQRHDRGAHKGWLSGMGRVTLLTDPPGATARFHRYEEVQRRLVAKDTGIEALTPIDGLRLPAGSYLAIVEHPEREPARVPLVVPRDGTWDNRHPETGAPHPVPLLKAGELGPEDCYVPGGWALLGGPEVQQGLPRRTIWLDGFVIRRHAVTNAEYLAFLNDLVAHGETEQAERCCPLEPTADGKGGSPVYHRDKDGRFFIGPDQSGDVWDPRWPVCLIDWFGASAWCQWETERTGKPWRLPGEYEREKAASGVDGRPYPWGVQDEPTWSCNRQRQASRPLPAPVGTHPNDRSPYNVFDVAGNIRDWCVDVRSPDGPPLDTKSRWSPPLSTDSPPADWYLSRGGSWAASILMARASVRFPLPVGYRLGMVGMRATRSLIPTRPEPATR